MFSVAPNIVLVPNMTQNAERKHRTQDANTAHNRLLEKLIKNFATFKHLQVIPTKFQINIFLCKCYSRSLLDKVMLRSQWHIGVREYRLTFKDPYMVIKRRSVWSKTLDHFLLHFTIFIMFLYTWNDHKS